MTPATDDEEHGESEKLIATVLYRDDRLPRNLLESIPKQSQRETYFEASIHDLQSTWVLSRDCHSAPFPYSKRNSSRVDASTPMQ
jgi:hypothetical protein